MHKNVFISSLACLLVACNGGGSTNSSNTSITPNPYPVASNYPAPPIVSFPTFSDPKISTQIAYGKTGESAVNLVMMVSIENRYFCSATPVYSDSSGNTWLVGAAHCFLKAKTNPDQVSTGEMVATKSVEIQSGIAGVESSVAVKAIYMPANYCFGATFDGLGKCPNYQINKNAGSNSQDNDIALIQANGNIGIPAQYPHLAKAESYPQVYTMAPVLSLGYGVNQLDHNNGKVLFFVSNYFYAQNDAVGYHYLLNSYFSSTNNGYTSLICEGDSGGGDLFWDGSSWLLLSEHSHGPAICGSFYPYLPDSSTNVSAYYDWIQQTMYTPKSCTLENNCVNN